MQKFFRMWTSKDAHSAEYSLQNLGYRIGRTQTTKWRTHLLQNICYYVIMQDPQCVEFPKIDGACCQCLLQCTYLHTQRMFACAFGGGEHPQGLDHSYPAVTTLRRQEFHPFCLLHAHKLREPFPDPLKINQRHSDKKTKAKFEFLTAFYEDEILPGYNFVSIELLGLIRPRRDREGNI